MLIWDHCGRLCSCRASGVRARGRTMSRGGAGEGSQRQACIPPGADGPPGKVSCCRK